MGTTRSGNTIQINSPARANDWRTALECILEKDFGEFVSFTQWNDFPNKFQYMKTKAHKIFKGVPLSELSCVTRGNALAKWVRDLDEHTSDPAESLACNNHKRPIQSSPYDYLRFNTRVEVKSAQMVWETHQYYWSFTFRDIKFRNFDELRLVFYTPGGLFVYRHDRVYGVLRNGIITDSNGMYVKISGPRHVEDWRESL